MADLFWKLMEIFTRPSEKELNEGRVKAHEYGKRSRWFKCFISAASGIMANAGEFSPRNPSDYKEMTNAQYFAEQAAVMADAMVTEYEKRFQ